ncbi:MAG: LptF/LptG family permease [Candidatus Omnitrophica bacterium]|nr:LptF/LptG family permease [Candidatus Omnitrophota bacterium]
MKILDRYLAKQLIFPIFFCSASLIFLVMMADIFDYLDEMVRHKTSFLFILKYYALLTPEIFVDTIPWASLLGTIYVLTSFNYHNEITAMKVSGLEITSIIRPIVFIGFLLGLSSFLISDQMVPKTTRKANEILKERIENKKTVADRKTFENVTYYGGKDRLYYARVFNLRESKLEDFIILWLDAKKNVKKKTVAQEAIWVDHHWELHYATDYAMEQRGEILGDPVFKKVAVYPEVNETPADILKAVSEGSAISYRDLKDYVTKLKQNGIKVSSELVTLHHKLSMPWQTLVVMFLSVPFLARTSRRRMIAMNVLLCLIFVFCFHMSGAILLALGKAGKLFPIVSVWSSNFIFGFGTFFFLEKANQ